MNKYETIINAGFENRKNLTLATASWELKDAVQQVLTGLDLGKVRVEEKIDGEWVVHQWLKKAVLLSFVLEQNKVIDGGYTNYFDKVPSKYSGRGKVDFEKFGVRVVPPATARRGSYIAPNVVLMPSFVNIGAYVDTGTMVDTWVTVGSCAQIGKNVHLSGRPAWARARRPDHHRGQLLHRHALGDRRGRGRRRRLGRFHGRLHRGLDHGHRP